MRCANSMSMERSWVINRTENCSSFWRSAISWRICRCTTTSSAVVGSSMMFISGRISLERNEVLAFEEDLASGYLGGRAENAEYGVRRRALAATRLAAEPHHLAGFDRKRNIVHGAHAPILEDVIDGQILDLKQRRHRSLPLLLRCRAGRWSSSGEPHRRPCAVAARAAVDSLSRPGRTG